MRHRPFPTGVLLGLLILALAAGPADAGIEITPASHDFGRVNVPTTSGTFDFTVTNNSDAVANVTAPVGGNGFSASLSALSIAPHASIVLHTAYTASGSGPYSFNMSVEGITLSLQAIANNAPVFNPPLASVYSACGLAAFSLTASATDPEGDARIWSLSSGLPVGATFNGSTGTLNWTPSCSDVGDYSVTIVVSDGLASTSGSFTLHVTCPQSQATLLSVTSNLNLRSNNTLDITFEPNPAGSWNVASWDQILANTKVTATGYAGVATAAVVSISATTGTASFSAASIASLLSGFSSNAFVTIAMELEIHLKPCGIVRIPFSVQVKKP